MTYTTDERETDTGEVPFSELTAEEQIEVLEWDAAEFWSSPDPHSILNVLTIEDLADVLMAAGKRMARGDLTATQINDEWDNIDTVSGVLRTRIAELEVALNLMPQRN